MSNHPAMNNATHKDDRNVSLQALRGVAAAAVVIYHAAHFTALRTGAAWIEEIFNGRFGFYGVLVFFVLSGFLMEGAVRRYDAKTFLLHRFVRLYPTYWLLTLIFVLVQSLRAGSWEPAPSWQALTLLPLGVMLRPLGVEWTLVYEVFFYMICTLLCGWRRAHLAVHLVWLAIIAGTLTWHAQFATTMQLTLAQIPFSTWNVGFICGGLAGHLNRSLTRWNPALLWLSGIALLLLSRLGTAAEILVAGSGTACIIIALVQTQRPAGFSSGVGVRALFLLGECSYGLYLAHSMAIQIALQYVPADNPANAVDTFIGMLGVGLAAGLLAGSIDVQLYRTLKRWIDSRIRRRSAPDTVAPVL